MDDESKGLHGIFITILLFILFFTFHSIPATETVKIKHNFSKKTQAALHQPEKDENKSLHEEIVSKEPEKTKAGVSIVQAEKPLESVDTSKAAVSIVQAEKPAASADTSKAKEVKAAIKGKKTANQIDIIAMNNPLYKTHKKPIVQFTHKKHVEVYSISCGSCHHDETGQPLELTLNDTVQDCIECHKETQKPKGEKLSKKERIMKYHFEAVHANCIGCHKDYNIENGDPKGKEPAPISCGKCHPKKKK